MKKEYVIWWFRTLERNAAGTLPVTVDFARDTDKSIQLYSQAEAETIEKSNPHMKAEKLGLALAGYTQ